MKAYKQVVRKYYKYQEQNWTQPYMTTDVSVGGDRFGAEASAINGANGPYKAFDGNSDNAGTCWQTPFSNTNPQWITFYNPVPLKVSSLVIYNYYNTSDTYTYFYIKKAIIQGSNDNNNWTDLKTITGSSWTRTITADLSNNTNFYNYYRIYIEERGYYSAYYSEAIILEVEITAKYRTVITGTSSDYDFYEDIDEYSLYKETVRHYYKYQYSSWIRPNLTSDGTLGGDSFASSGANGDSYKAFDGNASTYSQIFTNAETTKTLYFYNPNPLKITSLTFSYYSGTQIQEATIYGSNDYSNWDEIISYTNNTNPNTVTFPTNVLYYRYYKLYVTKAAGYASAYLGYILSDINEITFNAQERIVIESTSSDYDFYKDIDEYSAFNV